MKKIIPILALICVTIAFAGWNQLNPVMTTQKAVKDGGALELNGTMLYAFKGGNTRDFIAYDPALMTWTAKLNIPNTLKPNGKEYKKGVKAGGALTAYGDYIYAFKGGNTDEFWRYNTTDNTWTLCPVISAGVNNKKVKTGGALVTVGDAIYAFKGGNTNEFWMYDPIGLTWTAKANLVTPDYKKIKGGGALVAYDGDIYAFVGNNTYYFYAYDIATNTWSQKADAKFGLDSLKKRVKDGAALTVMNDKIYAFKGGNTQSFGLYDPATNTWSSLDTVPRGSARKKIKQGGSLANYDGVIYAFKGGNTNEFWKYTP
jgi:hypothetical protein